MNSEGLLIWGLLDQERKSGEVCSVPAHGPVQAGGPGADAGGGWRGKHGQGNSLFLCSLQLAVSGEGQREGRFLPRRLLGPEPARRKGEGTMMNAGFYPQQASSTVREGNLWQSRRGGRERTEGGRDGGGKSVFALGEREGKEKG